MASSPVSKESTIRGMYVSSDECDLHDFHPLRSIRCLYVGGLRRVRVGLRWLVMAAGLCSLGQRPWG